MGLISRIYTFVNGTSANATEVNAEFDTIHTAINGNLDNNNIAPSANIAASKLASIPMSQVLDYADSITDYSTTTDPGDTVSAALSLPATLAAEMERLRYRMGAMRKYIGNTYYTNAAGSPTAAAWFEPQIIGRNLLANPGFEQQSGGNDTAPDGWTLYSTPATLRLESAISGYSSLGGDKRSLAITTDGANEGIYQTVGGLKPSTKYLVGWAYAITDNGTTPGTVGIYTAGAIASGNNYTNLALTTSTQASTTVVIRQGIVKSDASGSDITVRLYATESGADFNAISSWMYELSDGVPDELPAIPVKVASLTTPDTTVPASFVANPGSNGAFTFETYTSFSLSQYVPYAGYRMTYEVMLSFKANSGQQAVYSFEIQEAINGGAAATVEGPYMYVSDDNGNTHESGQTLLMRWVRDNPTPGSTYAYTVKIGAFGNGANYIDMTLSPQLGDTGGTINVDYIQTSSRARLMMERM